MEEVPAHHQRDDCHQEWTVSNETLPPPGGLAGAPESLTLPVGKLFNSMGPNCFSNLTKGAGPDGWRVLMTHLIYLSHEIYHGISRKLALIPIENEQKR